MSEREVKILNISSAILILAIVACLALGVLAFVMQRAPKLNPAAYESQKITEITGTEPTEVSQNYQSFTINAAEAS